MTLVERFLKYVSFDTQSSDRADALNKLLLHMYFSYCYLIEY